MVEGLVSNEAHSTENPPIEPNSSAFYTLTRASKGSKEYIAGLRPDASATVVRRFFSLKTRTNLKAVDVGMPLKLVNLLLLKTGFVKIKSNALTLHREPRVATNLSFISSYRFRMLSATSKFRIACA